MSKRQTLILVGVWVIIFLFLGFPQSWQKVLAVITGLYIIITAYRLRSESSRTPNQEVPFVEHKAAPIIDDNSAAN